MTGHTDRPGTWGVYRGGKRIGEVRAFDPVEALAAARRAYPPEVNGDGEVVVSPDPDDRSIEATPEITP